MLERLPESARTPAVARAVMSPTGIVLAGAGASVGILAGAGPIVAVAAAAMCWAGNVAAAFLRQPRPERIDPFTVGEPWRSMVQRSQSTARRFDDAVRQTPAGPLHDRLADVGRRVDAAVREGWAIARRGHALDRAVVNLDIPSIQRQLAEVQRGGGDPQIAQAVRNQLQSAERLANVAADARARLARLNAELDETVARTVELSLSSADMAAAQPLGADLDALVGELETLRVALDEAG